MIKAVSGNPDTAFIGWLGYCTRPATPQLWQQQQKTITIARITIHVQLSSKMWHKQLFIMFASGSYFAAGAA